jgi:RNase P subunit RPR2
MSKIKFGKNKEHEEHLFTGDCQLCGKQNTPCRNHHMIPKRLLEILPKSKASIWEHQKVRICNRCNRFIHPENTLYRQIYILKKKLGYAVTTEEEQSMQGGSENDKEEEA